MVFKRCRRVLSWTLAPVAVSGKLRLEGVGNGKAQVGGSDALGCKGSK
jgi:hypothetical protein